MPCVVCLNLYAPELLCLHYVDDLHPVHTLLDLLLAVDEQGVGAIGILLLRLLTRSVGPHLPVVLQHVGEEGLSGHCHHDRSIVAVYLGEIGEGSTMIKVKVGDEN